MGAYTIFNSEDLSALIGDSMLKKGAYLLLAAGGAVILISTVGCFGALTENKCLLVLVIKNHVLLQKFIKGPQNVRLFFSIRVKKKFLGGGMGGLYVLKSFFFIFKIHPLSFCYMCCIFQYFVVLLMTFLVQTVAGIMGFVFYGQVRHYSLFFL